jgi:hypothetical protein
MNRSRYDVAFSFASEDEKQVLDVESELERGIKVFLYKKEQAMAWGQSLRNVLRDIFQRRSRLCVIFVSKHSIAKPWTIFERRIVWARTFQRLWRRPSNLLPVRLDDSKDPKFDPDVVFVDLRKTTPKELATLIERRLTSMPPSRRATFFLICVALLVALLIMLVLIHTSSSLYGTREEPVEVAPTARP